MKKWLFNPFVYIAGMRALLIGGTIMAVTAILAYFLHGHFDGAIDSHFGAATTIPYALLEQLVNWTCLVIPLYVLGRIASESAVRLIDIAGTVALARWPMFIMAFLGLFPVPQINPNATLFDLLQKVMTPSVIIPGLLSLPIIVWVIALLFNAFSVSTNLKGGKAVGTFIAGLVLAEVFSKLILHYLRLSFS